MIAWLVMAMQALMDFGIGFCDMSTVSPEETALDQRSVKSGLAGHLSAVPPSKTQTSGRRGSIPRVRLFSGRHTLRRGTRSRVEIGPMVTAYQA